MAAVVTSLGVAVAVILGPYVGVTGLVSAQPEGVPIDTIIRTHEFTLPVESKVFTFNALCRPEERVLGGGFQVPIAMDFLIPAQSFPSERLTNADGVRVQGWVLSIRGANVQDYPDRSGTVYAVCGTAAFN